MMAVPEGGVSGGGAGGLASWQTKMMAWMDDDEDQDSDTDSKLSGSAIVDSVMKRLRSKHSHYKDPSFLAGGEFSLDPIKDHSLPEQDEEQGEEFESGRGRIPKNTHSSPSHSTLSNGYHGDSSSTRSLQTLCVQRRQLGVGNSPNRSPGKRNYENTQPAAAAGYPYINRTKDTLSPVPESSGARVVGVSLPPSSIREQQARNWGGRGVGGPGTRSMENISQASPPRRRRDYEHTHIGMNGRAQYRDVRIPPPAITHGSNDMFSHSKSQETLPHDTIMNSDPYHSTRLYNSGTTTTNSYGGHPGGVAGGPSGIPPPPIHMHSHSASSGTSGISNHVSHSHSNSGGIHVPSTSHHSRSGSIGRGIPNSSSMGGYPPTSSILSTSAPMKSSWLSNDPHTNFDLTRSSPHRRPNYSRHEIPRESSALHHGGGYGGDRYGDPSHDFDRPSVLSHRTDHTSSSGRSRGEPNLDDVVDFLQSDDPSLVANAASYLQHLAYGDDSMKAGIRKHGAIPVLVSQLRNKDTKVLIAVLGALRNLSYGRSNNENKLQIAGEHGLVEIILALKMTRITEVRELLTCVLWNLSSCEELKLRIIKGCLHDLVEKMMVPCSGWSADIARDPLAKPDVVMWNVELRNTTGTLRNISSAGEPARVFLRSTAGLVDTLIWLLKAGVQQKSAADEKTVENTACVLRNLSYRLENEVDPQDGSEDVLDREWEQEQRRDMEEVNRAFTKASPGCLAFLKPRTHTEQTKTLSPNAINRSVYPVDFANPDLSSMPKRKKPVYGVALLWQPEVVYVYLAVVEQYSSNVETVEAAAGAIQNLTSCSWKWAVYSRNIVRTSNGLKLLADLLNNGHDSVVRASATALRNLALDPRNKAALGALAIPSIIPRLPFGTNHLGISEETNIALLCCLMELTTDSADNARLLQGNEGIHYLNRLTRSRQHTQKVVFAANKVCSILYEYKDCRSSLKREGWEIAHYQKLVKENTEHFDFDRGVGSISRDYQGSRRVKKKSKKQSKKSRRDKDEGTRGEDHTDHSPQPVATITMATSQLPNITEEPNYQSIPQSKLSQDVPLPSGPISIYQSIEDTQVKPAMQSTRSETAASTASGPLSTSGPLSITSQEEDQPLPEPDPNATYASVDIEKKRASRRMKERQQQEQERQQLEEGALDSWV